MTKNRTPTLVYLDPGMHPGLEVKGLIQNISSTYLPLQEFVRSVTARPVTNLQ